MTDTDLLKNTRNTRNTTGMGWGFSLCTADEGDSDSEPEDALAGSHNRPAPSPDLPVSEELRLIRDLDLGARQDPAIFKSNPWTIAKLRAATRKPPAITHSTGLSGLPSAHPQTLASTPTSNVRSNLDPHLKNRVPPQPTMCSKKPKVSPPRTRRKLSPVANPLAVGPNLDHLLGPPSIYLGPPALYKPDKITEAIVAQPRPSHVENCTSCEHGGIRPSSLGMHSKGPHFSSPGETTPHVLRIHLTTVVLVLVSRVALSGYIDPSLSPVKQSLHSSAHAVVSPNRFNFLDRLPDPLSPTSHSSHIFPTSPVKRRFPGALSAALSANRTGTKRKRRPSPSPSPLRSIRSVGNQIRNPLLTVGCPAERILPPGTPVHRQRASAYDSSVFALADEEWSTLPQNKPRISVSKIPTSVTQNSFRIPSLKLPGIGNHASKKSWLLTTFQPPPPLKVPNLMNTSGATENLNEDHGRIPLLETMNDSSSQTVVENENLDGE